MPIRKLWPTKMLHFIDFDVFPLILILGSAPISFNFLPTP